MAPPGTQSAVLTAEYANEVHHQKFEHQLGSIPLSLSTEDKSAYFASLHTSITKLQEEINAFLTAKMEEDKAQALNENKSINDKQEEENYGEEVVDE